MVPHCISAYTIFLFPCAFIESFISLSSSSTSILSSPITSTITNTFYPYPFTSNSTVPYNTAPFYSEVFKPTTVTASTTTTHTSHPALPTSNSTVPYRTTSLYSKVYSITSPSQVRPTPLLPTPVVHHTYAQRISAQAKMCPQSTVVDPPPIQKINYRSGV